MTQKKTRNGIFIKDDFKNINDFRAWCDGQEINDRVYKHFYSRAGTELRLKEIDGEFPSNATVDSIMTPMTVFSRPEVVEKLESQIEDAIAQSYASEVQKKKLAYNDLGLGVFSFDKVAQGMYRLHEFYSPTRQKVFDAELVSSSNGKHVLTADNSPIIERWEEKENGKPKIRTNTKKVFAYFPKVKRQRAAAEIYVSCGNYASISPENFLYSGMVAVIIAKKMIAASIPVKINTVIGWMNEQNTYCAAVVPLKNYDEPLDVNVLALATSDPTFWRYEGFKACVKLQEYFGQETGGAGLTGADLKSKLERTSNKTEVKNRFYFGRVQNQNEAVCEIKKAMEQISISLQS